MVTQDRAALWTDSRYWTQAERQLDCNWELQRTSQCGQGGGAGGVPAPGPPPPASLSCSMDPVHWAVDPGVGSCRGQCQPGPLPLLHRYGWPARGGPCLMGCTSGPWVWRGRSLLRVPPPWAAFPLQTPGTATARLYRAPAGPCCPWRPTSWTKCGGTRDPLRPPARSTASRQSSQVRLPPPKPPGLGAGGSKLSRWLSPLPGSSWQEKVAGIRQQMAEHTRRPTAVLLSGLEETACE